MIHAVHVAHEQGMFARGRFAKVREDAFAQILGFAHVDHSPFAVVKTIDAGQVRQGAGLFVHLMSAAFFHHFTPLKLRIWYHICLKPNVIAASNRQI
jgi:hypothetical protein